MSKSVTLNLSFLGTVHVRHADTPDAEVHFRLSQEQMAFVRSFYDKPEGVPLTFALCEVYGQGNGWYAAWAQSGEERVNTCFRAIENVEFALRMRAQGVLKKPSVGFMDQARENARVMGEAYRKARSASPINRLPMKAKQITVVRTKHATRVINRVLQTYLNEEANKKASWAEAKRLRELQESNQRATQAQLSRFVAKFKQNQLH